LRQALLEASQALQAEIERALEERGPLIRGTFGRRKRLCGNPACRCARGERHESAYLSASQDGKVRQVHVPVGDEDEVAAGVERYRCFRQLKARLLELADRQMKLVDKLGQSLVKPYPPKKPLPQAKRLLRAASKKGARKA
jgi:hypothetical protein